MAQLNKANKVILVHIDKYIQAIFFVISQVLQVSTRVKITHSKGGVELENSEDNFNNRAGSPPTLGEIRACI